MTQLLRFSGVAKRDPAVDAWLKRPAGELGEVARVWFDVMRRCGDDVRGVLHDGHPTACVDDAGFAYLNVFRAHLNVGFFRGADLADPAGLLEGTGKFMRHVKLRPEKEIDGVALEKLIVAAYLDMRKRVHAEARGAAKSQI